MAYIRISKHLSCRKILHGYQLVPSHHASYLLAQLHQFGVRMQRSIHEHGSDYLAVIKDIEEENIETLKRKRMKIWKNKRRWDVLSKHNNSPNSWKCKRKLSLFFVWCLTYVTVLNIESMMGMRFHGETLHKSNYSTYSETFSNKYPHIVG